MASHRKWLVALQLARLLICAYFTVAWPLPLGLLSPPPLCPLRPFSASEHLYNCGLPYCCILHIMGNGEHSRGILYL